MKSEFKQYFGPYLGQSSPSKKAELFCPEIFNSGQHEHSALSFSPDGKEIFWSRWRRPDEGLPQVIMTMSQQADGKWSEPTIASFSGEFSDGGPVFCNQGRTLLFYSTRPQKTWSANDNNLWRVDKVGFSWGKPVKLPAPINTSKLQVSPSLSAHNKVVFMSFLENGVGSMGIFESQWQNSKFSSPKFLGPPFDQGYRDWLPCIAPDESFLLFSSNRRSENEGFDLYVSFREDNGAWGIPKNLGPNVNTSDSERFPGLSPDGQYLFFVRESSIYWVSIDVVHQVR